MSSTISSYDELCLRKFMKFIGLEVFTAASMKMAVFWVVARVVW
jgi:hypothetical protein